MKTTKPATETRLMLCECCQAVHDGERSYPDALPANCDGIIKGFSDCPSCSNQIPVRWAEPDDDRSKRHVIAAIILLGLLHFTGVVAMAIFWLNT